MSVPRRSLASLLADHTDAPYDPEHREFIEAIASALCARHLDLPHWPESVVAFYACYDLNFQVGSGGFAQAAYNAPELFPLARKAFERFGRWKAAELCRRVEALLPAEHAEHQAKGFAGEESLEEVFNHFTESRLSQLNAEVPDEFWVDDKLQELVEQHRIDFASIDRLD